MRTLPPSASLGIETRCGSGASVDTSATTRGFHDTGCSGSVGTSTDCLGGRNYELRITRDLSTATSFGSSTALRLPVTSYTGLKSSAALGLPAAFRIGLENAITLIKSATAHAATSATSTPSLTTATARCVDPASCYFRPSVITKTTNALAPTVRSAPTCVLSCSRPSFFCCLRPLRALLCLRPPFSAVYRPKFSFGCYLYFVCDGCFGPAALSLSAWASPWMLAKMLVQLARFPPSMFLESRQFPWVVLSKGPWDSRSSSWSVILYPLADSFTGQR